MDDFVEFDQAYHEWLDPDLRAIARNLRGAPSHMLRQLYGIQAGRGDTVAAIDALFREHEHKRDEGGRFAPEATFGAFGQFSEENIDAIRATMHEVKPKDWGKVRHLIEGLTQPQLKQIRDADIPFLSLLAKNRIANGQQANGQQANGHDSWKSPWWGDAEFKEAEHPRDEEGKFTESGASQVKDLPEGKLPSHFNDFITRGDFELSARKMEKSQFQAHDKYTIEMRPKTPPGIKTVGKQGKEYQYDPELADVIVLSPDDPEIRREIVDVKEDLPARLEEVLEDDPEMMYRGISSEEFDFIRNKGIVQSKGAYNLGPAQEGLTYWSSSVKQAGFYANGFQPPWMKATWNKPAYVVVAKRAASEDTRHVPGTGKDEIGVARAVDQDEVVEVWRGRAAWISVGEQDVTKYGEGDDAVYKEGSGSLTQTGVVWEKVPDDGMFNKYVRSAAQDALPAFDAAYARWLGDREFREEDVNRDPEGKFAEQAGEAPVKAEQLAIPEEPAAPPKPLPKPKTKGPARVFVSPNVGDLSFEQAQSELRGKRQKVISEVSSAIDSRLKIRSQNTDVVGAWADGAENSLMITSTGDPAKARAAAIIKGAITDQKQVLVFTPGKGGDNVMTSFEIKGDLAAIHGKLLQNGLAYHTLEPVEGGARVHVYVDDIDDDGNSPTVNAVAALTTDEGVEYLVTEGNGEFIGAPTNYRGSDAAVRARAQAEYEWAISEIEASGQCPECNLREIWDDARDHWNTATGQAAGLGLRGSQGHEALISSRRPMGVGALESDRYRRIDLDAMRASPKELFRRNMELLRDPHGYPNLRPSEVDGKSPDEIAEAAIAHAVANLKFLYQTAPKRLRDQAHEWYEGAHNLAQDQASKFDLPIQSAAGVFAALSPQMDWDKNVYFAQQVIDIYHNKKDERWDDSPDSAMSRTAAKIWKEKDLPHIERIAGKSLAELTDPVDKAYWIRTYNEAHTTREYQRHSPTGKPLGLALKADGTPAAAGWGSVPAIENAIKALESGGDRAILSDAMGDMHKVRSFYNNILDPKSKNYDVTMDTHAVGAALLRPLSGADTAVMHSLGTNPQSEDVKPPNWQGAAKSKITGVKGTYPLWADAYRQAASDLGIEPRVLQSAVWEAKRQLFGGMADKAKDQIEAAWHAYREGADLAATQRRVMAIAKRDRARRRKARGKDSGRLAGAVDETAWHPGDPAELYRSGLGQGAARSVDGGSRGAVARGTAEHDWRAFDRGIANFFARDAAFDAAYAAFFASDAEFKEHEHKRDEKGRFATQAKAGTEPAGRQASELVKPTTVTVDAIVAKIPGAAERIAQVRQRLADSVPTDAPVAQGGHKRPDGTWTPERAAVHEKILNNLFTSEAIAAATPKPGEKPTLHLLGGRGGSGKSWFTGKDGTIDKSTVLYLNNDDVKEALPGYEGWNAALLHEESSEISDTAEALARDQGLNIILDGTMKTERSLLARVKAYQEAGYRITGHYMYVAPEVSTERAIGRFMRGGETGRFVPPEYTFGSTTNEASFDAAREQFDDWEIYDNSGTAPKLHARKSVSQQAGTDTARAFRQRPAVQSGGRQNGGLAVRPAQAADFKEFAAIDKEINRFFAQDAEFKEEWVKRDEEGKFATQAKSGAPPSPPARKALHKTILENYGFTRARADKITDDEYILKGDYVSRRTGEVFHIEPSGYWTFRRKGEKIDSGLSEETMIKAIDGSNTARQVQEERKRVEAEQTKQYREKRDAAEKIVGEYGFKFDHEDSWPRIAHFIDDKGNKILLENFGNRILRWTLAKGGERTTGGGEVEGVLGLEAKIKKHIEGAERIEGRVAREPPTKEPEWSSGALRVNETSPISRDFRSKIANGLKKVPSAVRDKLNDSGIMVNTGKYLIDIDPELHGVRPRGWSEGSIWDAAEGCYNSASKEICFTEYRKFGEVETLGRGEGVLWHEIGHGFDDALERWSHAPVFTDAHRQDEAAIPDDKRGELAYYLQPGIAGPEEAFAELFGWEMGRGSHASDIRRYFPKTLKVVQEQIRKVTQSQRETA